MQKGRKLTKIQGIVPQGSAYEPKMYLTRDLPKVQFAKKPRRLPVKISQNAVEVQGNVPQSAPFDPKYSQTGITPANVRSRKEEMDAIISRQAAIRDDITASRLGESMDYERKSKNYAPILDTLSQLGVATFATSQDVTGQAAQLIQDKLTDFMRGKTPAERVSQLPLFLKEVASALLKQVDAGELNAGSIPKIIHILETRPLAPILGPEAPDPEELAAHMRGVVIDEDEEEEPVSEGEETDEEDVDEWERLIRDFAEIADEALGGALSGNKDYEDMLRKEFGIVPKIWKEEERYEVLKHMISGILPPRYLQALAEDGAPNAVIQLLVDHNIADERGDFGTEDGERVKNLIGSRFEFMKDLRAAWEEESGDTGKKNQSILDAARRGDEEASELLKRLYGITSDIWQTAPDSAILFSMATGILPQEFLDFYLGLVDVPDAVKGLFIERAKMDAAGDFGEGEERIYNAARTHPEFLEMLQDEWDQFDSRPAEESAEIIEEPAVESEPIAELASAAKRFDDMRDDNKRTIREARKVIPKLGELVKTGQTTDDQIAEDVMEGMKTAPADVEKLFSEAKSASNTTRRRLPFSRVSRSDDMYAIYGQLFKVLETTPKTITVQRWLEDKDAKAKTRVKEDTQIPDILIMDIWAFYRMIEYIKAPTPENLLQAQVSMYLARIRGTSLAIRQLLYYKKGQPLGIAESGPTVADRKDNIVEVSKEGFGRRRIGRAFNAASAKLDKMYKGGRISRGQYIAGQKKLAAMLSRI